ncbi:hypothetical protein DXG01_007594 [Tephrocybe rancida]|nr:hypothetical protein DXG01_007594 [Tephrocybe rancida]
MPTELQAGQRYSITNVKSGTALDLSGTDGVSILGWQKHDGDNQKASWELQRDNNQWTFRNVATGKFLGLADGTLENGLALRAVENAVAWDIFEDHDDHEVFRIFVPPREHVEKKFNADLSNHGDKADGTPVAVWGKTQASTNQTWRFQQRE